MKKLYHCELGFPKGLKTRFGFIPITYTQYAQKAAEDDTYGKIVLPSTLNTSSSKCIEAEVTDSVVTKLVYCVKYNNDLDMVLVLSRDCSVKAVRFHKRSDGHPKVNSNRYTIPSKEKQ